jgi:hypothetical protein
MTTPQNRQLSDDELELLSSYIDNQLTAAERGALEQRLGHEPALRAALDDLRGTVALVRELAPLPPPRSFALDPAAFAPRPSPLFGWLRLGATLASVLLALTFAVDFVGRGVVSTSAPAAAPAPASEAQRNALLATETPAALSAPAAGGAAVAPTAAPAAAPTAAPLAAPAPQSAAEPTAAPAAAAAEATAAPAATTAPEAQGLPSPTAEATSQAVQSADMNATAAAAPTSAAAPAAQPTPAQAQLPGYSVPPTEAPAGGYIAPLATSGSQSPGTAQPEQPVPGEPRSAAPQAAIRPIRLVEFGLAGLALVLGLGALWVRWRGR